MSGLEVLGVAASIIQIADLGARVSIKLSTFYHKVKQANDNIQNLSTDVALTCTVLKQLGDNLQQDENVKLYSPDAFSVAKDIMGECDKVFRQIESAMEDDISPSPNTSAVKYHVRKAARKLHFVFLEPQLSVLQSNLDRLKYTMLLMLNVIIYAGQVQRKEAEANQQEQKDIIEILADEQKIKTKRYQQLTKAIEFADSEENTRAAAPPYTSDDDAPFGVLAVQDNTKKPDESIPEELAKYANLIKSLLTSVEEMKSALDHARYQRIKKGVLTIHDKEFPPLQHQHGDSTCNKLFDGPLFERRKSSEDEEERPSAVKSNRNALVHTINLEEVLEHGERLDTIQQRSNSDKNVIASIPAIMDQIAWRSPDSWMVREDAVSVDDNLPEEDLTKPMMEKVAKRTKKSKQNRLSVQEEVQEEVQEGVQDLILKWTTLDVSEIA